MSHLWFQTHLSTAWTPSRVWQTRTLMHTQPLASTRSCHFLATLTCTQARLCPRWPYPFWSPSRWEVLLR